MPIPGAGTLAQAQITKQQPAIIARRSDLNDSSKRAYRAAF